VYTDLHIRAELKKKSLRIAIPNNYWALIFLRSYITIILPSLPYALVLAMLFWNVETTSRVYCNNILCWQIVFENPNTVFVTNDHSPIITKTAFDLSLVQTVLKGKTDGTATFWWKTILEYFRPSSSKIYSNH